MHVYPPSKPVHVHIYLKKQGIFQQKTEDFLKQRKQRAEVDGQSWFLFLIFISCLFFINMHHLNLNLQVCKAICNPISLTCCSWSRSRRRVEAPRRRLPCRGRCLAALPWSRSRRRAEAPRRRLPCRGRCLATLLPCRLSRHQIRFPEKQ